MIIDCHVHMPCDAVFLASLQRQSHDNGSEPGRLRWCETLRQAGVTVAMVLTRPLGMIRQGDHVEAAGAINEQVAAFCCDGCKDLALLRWAWVAPNDLASVGRFARDLILPGRAVGFGEIAPCDMEELSEDFLAELVKWSARAAAPVLLHEGAVEQRISPCLDLLLEEFPHSTVIVAHLGGKAWRAAYLLARKHPNVYLDFAGITPRRLRCMFADRYQFRRLLDDLQDRILFGSNFPMLNPKSIVQLLRQWAPSGQALEKILCRNAAALFAPRLRRLGLASEIVSD